MRADPRLDRRVPQQRGDQRRSALLEALDDALHDHSLESINVADISSRAGVSRSAFYFYFENKAYAVAALMAEMYDEAFAATNVLVGQEGTTRWRIEQSITGLFDALERHVHVYRAMLEARGTNQSVRELWESDRESFVEPVAGMIRAERAAGRAPDGVDATALASVLLEVNDRALERLAVGSRIPRAQHVEALVQVWLGSIYGTAPTEEGAA
jgi:TetR/AcrR family transcriptional regulator, ethionamide resistance regulator